MRDEDVRSKRGHYLNGEVIAIVEAKRTITGPCIAQTQAEFYVREIEKRQSLCPINRKRYATSAKFLSRTGAKRPSSWRPSRCTRIRYAKAWQVRVEDWQIACVEWLRVKNELNAPEPVIAFMGRVTLSDVPVVLQFLLVGSVVQLGDNVVFGNGACVVEPGDKQGGNAICHAE